MSHFGFRDKVVADDVPPAHFCKKQRDSSGKLVTQTELGSKKNCSDCSDCSEPKN